MEEKKKIEISELSEIIQKNWKYFVTPADCRFLKNMINTIKEYQKGGWNPKNIVENPQNISVIERIVKHCEYYKEHKEARYLLNDEYITREHMLKVIKDMLEKAKHEPYLAEKQRSILGSIGLQLKEDKGYLSAKQVMIVEMFMHEQNVKEDKKIIFLFPNDDLTDQYYDFAARIVDYALTGKKRTAWPKLNADEIMPVFWTKFFNGNRIDLAPLADDAQKFDYGVRDKYLEAISFLEKYLNRINPETHEISLRKAVPKTINE